jgi:hypothetical protein
VEPDERVALEADGFAKEPIGQGVPGLPASGRSGVEQLDCARRQAEGSLYGRLLLLWHVTHCITGDCSRGKSGEAITDSIWLRSLVRYHDVMMRKSTTVRMPEDLAETAEVVARARGVSINELVLDALRAELDRVRNDTEFMERLRALVERDREILDRLAE